ncbi:dTDP-4-dehydrorhamnose reductase [Pusillimonas sp. ANT_WB101]|uniref:dTDP-4-dehydrorhamnose reductase n=1 Tax=Pusillimonas sp. ANT_WB101 TaxID=2597356 RepID=UPI0011ED8FEE|nr:dTDP-4-dehydrorhamnose reductase [Pusillimonas sp. ANT_WB101]KAA0889526.1 dTDP-4-dehydrorhamnose reductase [Pusillimonas sp. ANT_WB101]
MIVLLTGGGGQLGRCLLDRMPSTWRVAAPAQHELDIVNEQAVQAYVADLRPALIINAAAYTAVDNAEDDVQAVYDVNAHGAESLARAAARSGAGLLHVSTDYVFDGGSDRPYVETDAAMPLNVYGHSKRAGEMAVLQALPQAIVVRSSWLFSEYGNNFVRTMLRLVVNGAEQVQVVDDQLGFPTYAGDLADVLIALAGRMPNVAAGLYHYCGAGNDTTPVSWCEFARAIFDCADRVSPCLQLPVLLPIDTSAYPTAARRPMFSALSCEKLAAVGLTGQQTLPPLLSRTWRVALQRVVCQLLQQQRA